MDLKEIGQVDPDTHWYYRSKLVPLRWALRRWAPRTKHILDVGAGSGLFSRALVEDREGVTITCVDPNYEAESSSNEGRLVLLRCATPDQIGRAGVALFIDVLEHVDDDLALLRSYTDHLPSQTLVLVTVPAFQSLWSAHDEFLDHRRRYRLDEVVRLMEAAGLEVVHHRYLFGLLFPRAWAVRRLRRGGPEASDLRPAPAALNGVLRVALSAEHRCRWNRAAGLSAFVAARVR